MNWAYNILRFGLGLTLVWAGFMILNDPVSWGGFVKPWAQEIIPGDIESFMKGVGVVDIVLGGFIALGFWVRMASFLTAVHLAGILVVSGVDPVTVRDIGLLGTAISLAVWPKGEIKNIDLWEKQKIEKEEGSSENKNT